MLFLKALKNINVDWKNFVDNGIINEKVNRTFYKGEEGSFYEKY